MIRIFAANLKFGRRARRRTREHVAHLLRTTADPVVIGVQEAKNVVLATVLARIARALQRTKSTARAGSAIITRGVRARRFRLFLGGVSSATLPRWIARAKIRTDDGPLVVFSVHVPPARAGSAAQWRYLRRLKKRTDRLTRRGIAWVVCIDANMPIAEVARYLGGRAYGVGIVGVITSPDVVVARHDIDTYGLRHSLTDHPAPWIDISGLRPHKKKEIRR